MPFKKYRSIEAMGADRRDLWRDQLDAECLRRMDQLWRRSAQLADRKYPKGIFKFRSIEEMQAHREEMERENIERLRRERLQTAKVVQQGRR